VRTSRQKILDQDEVSDEDDDEDDDAAPHCITEEDDDGSEEDFVGFGAEGPWSGSEEDETDTQGLEDGEEPVRTVPVKSQQPAAPPKRPSPEPQQTNGDLASSLKTARETDRRKGKAVAKQIVRP
jgi:protein AATF/BFR2